MKLDREISLTGRGKGFTLEGPYARAMHVLTLLGMQMMYRQVGPSRNT